MNGEFYPRRKSVEWTSSLAGHDGVFLVRDNGKIIREDVNGSQTTIVDESNVYYVCCRGGTQADCSRIVKRGYIFRGTGFPEMRHTFSLPLICKRLLCD